MEDLLCKINNDSTFMVIAAISVVILIFVLLMVVISSMRIKGYKDSYVNAQIDIQEKDALIEKLQTDLGNIKIKNAQNEQELLSFSQTKEKLKDTETKLEHLQTAHTAEQKLQAETRTELDHMLNSHGRLTEEHKVLSKKFETVQDENNKLHVNNARLLMKLETEARFTRQANAKKNSDKS